MTFLVRVSRVNLESVHYSETSHSVRVVVEIDMPGGVSRHHSKAFAESCIMTADTKLGPADASKWDLLLFGADLI